MKKVLIFAVLMSSMISKADDRNHTLSVVGKYGPSGYVTSRLGTQNNIQPVVGLRFQEAVADGPLVLGVGYFMDSTVDVSVGLRF